MLLVKCWNWPVQHPALICGVWASAAIAQWARRASSHPSYRLGTGEREQGGEEGKKDLFFLWGAWKINHQFEYSNQSCWQVSLPCNVCCLYSSAFWIFSSRLLAFRTEGHILLSLYTSFLRLMYLNDITVCGDGEVPKFALLPISVALLNKSALGLWCFFL